MQQDDQPRISDLARHSFSTGTMPGVVDEVVRRALAETGCVNRDAPVGGWSPMSDLGERVNHVREVELDGFAVELYGWVEGGRWLIVSDLSVTPVD